MDYVIGGDLGTSALKLTLVDENGNVVKSIEEPYHLYLPKEGYSEENPKDWANALLKGIQKLSEEANGNITGICLDGQMHGLVMLDENREVLGRAILWNDSRSVQECKYLNEEFGMQNLLEETGNIAYPGFTLPKILWVRNNEPEVYSRIRYVMLPKDYLNFVLTGEIKTDYSDAAGTLMLDVKNKKWSEKMIEISGLKDDMLPEIIHTGDVVGKVKEELVSSLKLKAKTVVYQGAADNAAGAIGNGVIQNGECNISLGTSGTILVVTDKFAYPDNGAIHSFLSGTDSYCLLACMLSAASCLKWLNESVFQTKDYTREQENVEDSLLGHNSVFFLPYLMGERSPINDPHARGLFFGLSLDTKRSDLTLAVLEGVSFALKDSFEKIKEMNVPIEKAYLTGGGTKSKLWVKILANVLNIPLMSLSSSYGASYGMALVALVSEKKFDSLQEAKDKFIKVESITLPEENLTKLYQERYEKFKRIYPAIKPLE